VVSLKTKFECVPSIGGCWGRLRLSQSVVIARYILTCDVTSGQPEPIIVVTVCAINDEYSHPLTGLLAYSNMLNRTPVALKLPTADATGPTDKRRIAPYRNENPKFTI